MAVMSIELRRQRGGWDDSLVPYSDSDAGIELEGQVLPYKGGRAMELWLTS